MRQRMSNALEIRSSESGHGVCCTKCGHRLGPAGEPWKTAAHLAEDSMRGSGGVTYTTGHEVVLRRFTCPECGALLDTETALRGDPFLNDVIFVKEAGGT